MNTNRNAPQLAAQPRWGWGYTTTATTTAQPRWGWGFTVTAQPRWGWG